jgi:RimJ/RimL family protein N-acetyltransferase
MYIRTARLEIREFMPEDVRAYCKLESTPSVVRYQYNAERTIEESKELVKNNIDAQTANPRKLYELAVTYDKRFIGRVGAFVKNGHADIWYAFMPAVQGKGFATEAVEAFIPLLGDGLTLEIECDPRNVASWKLGLRLGFKEMGRVEKAEFSKGEWVDSMVLHKVVPEASPKSNAQDE